MKTTPCDAIVMTVMMAMKMLTKVCFVSGHARLVLKSLSHNSDGKRRSDWGLSFTDGKAMEMLTRHPGLISFEARNPIL